jgi:putative ATPase
LDIFKQNAQKNNYSSAPLAERMRPGKLDEFVGQEHIAGKDGLLYRAIENDHIFSMILWGPPGCGKTTFANIIAKETSSHFLQISAVLSGVKEIRSIIEAAKKNQTISKKRTILFVDEIHRFNKAQQDAFLKHVENGLITLIGATTENPSFEVISALISRCRVITLEPLSAKNIETILERAIKDRKRGLGDEGITLTKDAMRHFVMASDGDVRAALNGLEIAASILMWERGKKKNGESLQIELKDVEKAFQRKALIYDKSGEEHYNIISAFHKSLRGSDPDAALYWMERMLLAGEDPFYIARRMIRFASEDIGNADPYALQITMSATEAYRLLGNPEGKLALAQAAVYLATAPKSNSIYEAYGKVGKVIERSGTLPVPMHIRNAPTNLMHKMGYGKDYRYAHDYKGAFVPQDYMPEKLEGQVFYNPSSRGYEKIVKQRLERWRDLKKKKNIKQQHKA